MSYILEALRRADVERERGGIPGLNAQSVPLFGMEPETPLASRPWVWLAAGLSAGLLVALAWRFVSAPPAQPAIELAAAAPAAPTAATPEPPAPSTAPIVTETADPPAPSRALTAKPPAVTPPRAAMPEKPLRQATAKAPPAAPAPKADAPPPPKEVAFVNERIYARDDLPSDIRAQLPSLTVGGSMYSDKPALRMVILNGQLFHEGDTPAPGTVLEQIRLKSAVLRYKGYRYEIAY